MAISKEDVKEAVDKLQADGIEKPSAGSVREILRTGGMSTIQKYLNEIRLEESEAEADPVAPQQLEAVVIDQSMIENHVKTIVEQVAQATRSTYLQQLIEFRAQVDGLTDELKTAQENYDELAEDYEELQGSIKEDTGAWELQNSKIIGLEGELEVTRLAAEAEVDELSNAHAREVLGLQAANEQLEKIITAITKRIGVVESK